MKDTQAELLSAIQRYEDAAEVGVDDTDRALALRLYRGDNVDPQEEGRSQFVSRDCYDVVETVKPQLLKLFLSGDEIVRFDPVGPEDVEEARLETEYINNVALQHNDAFDVFESWIHDGLVQRNGYVLAHWDEREQVDAETYRGLSDDELALLLQDPALEVVGHEETVDEYGNAAHAVKLEKRTVNAGVKYINVPPESVIVDPNHDRVSLGDADFVQRRETKTLSQLRAEGFDVADDLSDGGYDRHEDDRYVRDPSVWRDDGVEADPSMRRVRVRETWIRTALRSGGKKAELRHCIVVGTTFLLDEDADFVPLIAWCPKPMPHQHTGMSLIDETHDVQQVKTATTRAMLDNMYLANNGRYAINTDIVNLDDMLVSRPGGVVRVSGEPGSAIFPLTHPQTQNVALQAVEYFDQVKEQRTGLTRYTSGLDPNSLNKTATGIMQLQAASMQRIELIARRFAEAVKELMWLTHGLTLKHGRKAEMVRLSNKWVAVDPRSWKARKDMTISVGLGTGNRQEQSMFLMQILQLALGPGLQLGLTEPPKVYQMLSRLTNNAGFKSAEEFWSDPSAKPPQQPAPDPKLMIEQAKLQQAQQATQIDAQIKQAELQADAREAAQKLQQVQQEAILRAEVEMQKAQLQADTQLRIARMGAYTQRQQAMARRVDAVKVKAKRDGLQ